MKLQLTNLLSAGYNNKKSMPRLKPIENREGSTNHLGHHKTRNLVVNLRALKNLIDSTKI
jgi:hypothetical protein